MHVEHEADEGTFEAGARTHVDGEARTAEFGGAFEVEDAELFAEFPVRFWGEVEVRLFAPGFDREIVFLGFAGGDFIAGEIGNAREGKAHLFVESGRGFVQFVELLFEGAGFVHHGGGIFAFALEGSNLLA